MVKYKSTLAERRESEWKRGDEGLDQVFVYSGCKRKVLCPASSRGMEGNVVLAARLGEITVYADLKIRHQRRLVLSLPVAYLCLCRCFFWGAGVREVPEAPKIN